MTYYVLTFHEVRNDGAMGKLTKCNGDVVMLFDSWEAAMDYGRMHVDYARTNFRIHEKVLFTGPTTVDINSLL